jgi:hypothetical protein
LEALELELPISVVPGWVEKLKYLINMSSGMRNWKGTQAWANQFQKRWQLRAVCIFCNYSNTSFIEEEYGVYITVPVHSIDWSHCGSLIMINNKELQFLSSLDKI